MLMYLHLFVVPLIYGNCISGEIYKEVFKVRSGKYKSFNNVDYKFINIPSNIYELNVYFKFVRWIGFAPLCPSSINITSVFQYGNFPLFNYDRKFQYNLNQRNRIDMFIPTAEKKIVGRSFKLESPKSGTWLFGSIYDNNDRYEHLAYCLADLQVTITGYSMRPSISYTLPLQQQSAKISIFLNNSHGKLIEISSREPLSRIRISHLCRQCDISVSVGNGVIPIILTLKDAINTGRIFRYNHTIFHSEQVEMAPVIFLYLRMWKGQMSKVSILIQYATVDLTTQLVMLPALMKIRGDMLFAYRFITAQSDSRKIPIVLISGKITIIPFYIEPIKDQGNILSIELSMFPANYTVYVCISDVGIANSDELKIISMNSSVCSVPESELNNDNMKLKYKFYYPVWNWWYLTVMVNPTYPIYRENYSLAANLSIISKNCIHEASWCNKRGFCLLSAVDTGLISACHCFKPFFGLDCLQVFLPSVGKVKENLYRRNFLVFSNIAFLPAIVVAIMQRLYVLVFIYMTAAGFSMVYHMCYMEDTDLAYCALKVEDLAYYDHLAAVISIWITMMSLSTLTYKIQMLLNVVMIFLCAILADVIQKSIWFYAIPILIGLIILFTCWVYRMHQLKCIFPPLDWWVFGMFPCLVIAGIGFIMFRLSVRLEYAYYLYHSMWHILIAISICFVLPNTKRWIKALNQTTNNGTRFSLLSNLPTFNSEKWYKFKKDFNYYMHLDVFLNPLLERNSRWSICKSY